MITEAKNAGTQSKLEQLPPLGKDPAFIGMTATQFLGAFNDNLFKQLLLLIALDYKEIRGAETDVYQAIATFAFSVPFILLSGFAGYYSDKVRKRSIVVGCKALEIVVMLAAMLAFMTGTIGSEVLIVSLIVVLFFMGAQSALFGPSKFGILPEMLRESDLPQANGIIQMTTFLAIILGTALSGILKDVLPDQLWVISLICVGIAIVGTGTSLLLRPTPIANPDMKFSPDCLVIERSAWEFIRDDRPLYWTMIVYAVFWFAGGVVMLTVNAVCKLQLGFSDTTTSLLSTCMGIGIAIGCVLCGKFSKGQVRFDLVRKAGWGLGAATTLVSVFCIIPMNNQWLHAWMIGGSLLATGFAAGIFAVPPQVFIQARPPESSKGRVIGGMNLITWIGITAAAAYYYLWTTLFSRINWPASWIFLTVGVIFVACSLLFREPNPGKSVNKPKKAEKETTPPPKTREIESNEVE